MRLPEQRIPYGYRTENTEFFSFYFRMMNKLKSVYNLACALAHTYEKR